MAWIFEVLSILATAGVVWLTWQQKQLDSRLVDIEESREEDRLSDRRSANLRAALDSGRTVSTSNYSLSVKNTGPAKAEDIKVYLAGTLATDHEAVLSGPDMGFTLGPGSSVSFSVVLHATGPRPPWDLKLEWSDESSNDRSYETTITLP